MAPFVRKGDELRFSLEVAGPDASTEIYVRSADSEARGQDVYQAAISYATQPRRNKRDSLFVNAEVLDPSLGISDIHLRCEVLRDYFYVGNRHRAWDRQPSFYELLRVGPSMTPAELRLAFKLRRLELRAAHAQIGDLRALERAFNVLARPELRACYDKLLADPSSPTLFPYGAFGSLLITGNLSRDRETFYATRILAFLPEQSTKMIRVPLRNVVFYDEYALYRDSRRKIEILFDKVSIPWIWDSSWNQWKHLLGATIVARVTFVQSGRYSQKTNGQLVKWETALPSRVEVTSPLNIAEQIAQARKVHHRFDQFAEAFDQIRVRIQSVPVERTDLQRLCMGLGVPGDFDVSAITWKPDYDAFYYQELCRRARHLYFLRAEYIFDLENLIVVETPQLGHATYLFSKPANMPQFLATYTGLTKDDILHNRGNVAEKLGFVSRLIHGVSPRDWLKELKVHLGEIVEYT